MPFDPFFSSSYKKHFIPVGGVDEEYGRIMNLPYEKRAIEIRALSERIRNHMGTTVDKIVLRKLGFAFTHAQKTKVLLMDDKRHQKNEKRFKKLRAKGKTIVVFSGYNTNPK